MGIEVRFSLYTYMYVYLYTYVILYVISKPERSFAMRYESDDSAASFDSRYPRV